MFGRYLEAYRQRAPATNPPPAPGPAPNQGRTWWDGITYQCDFTIDRGPGFTAAEVRLYVVPPLGHELLAIAGQLIGTGTNTLEWARTHGDIGAVQEVRWNALAAAADQVCTFPQALAGTGVSSSLADSTDPIVRLVGGAQRIRAIQGLGGLADTLRVVMSVRVMRIGAIPPGRTPQYPIGFESPSATLALAPPSVIFDPSSGNFDVSWIPAAFTGATFLRQRVSPPGRGETGISTDAFTIA